MMHGAQHVIRGPGLYAPYEWRSPVPTRTGWSPLHTGMADKKVTCPSTCDTKTSLIHFIKVKITLGGVYGSSLTCGGNSVCTVGHGALKASIVLFFGNK